MDFKEVNEIIVNAHNMTEYRVADDIILTGTDGRKYEVANVQESRLAANMNRIIHEKGLSAKYKAFVTAVTHYNDHQYNLEHGDIIIVEYRDGVEVERLEIDLKVAEDSSSETIYGPIGLHSAARFNCDNHPTVPTIGIYMLVNGGSHKEMRFVVARDVRDWLYDRKLEICATNEHPSKRTYRGAQFYEIWKMCSVRMNRWGELPTYCDQDFILTASLRPLMGRSIG